MDRIEMKLDLKADVSLVNEVASRQAAFEQRMDDVMTGKVVSPLSAMYMQRFTDMEKAVEKMEMEDVQRVAVVEAAKSKADGRYSQLLWIVSLMTIANIAVTLVLRVV